MTDKNILGHWYQKHFAKWIPAYGLLTLIIGFLVNSLVYWGTQRLMGNAYHYDFTTSFDRQVPFIKEWIVIYLGCYIFWIVNYILICREGKEQCYRFATADVLSRLICGIFFVVIPTTNIRPLVKGSDVYSWLVRYIYMTDPATNLFPSIHCLASWFCFIGIRKSKKIPQWYKIFSCAMALVICVSTQFTKQHYMIDIAGGILIAEVCFWIANHTSLYRYIEFIYDKIVGKIFGVTVKNDEKKRPH